MTLFCAAMETVKYRKEQLAFARIRPFPSPWGTDGKILPETGKINPDWGQDGHDLKLPDTSITDGSPTLFISIPRWIHWGGQIKTKKEKWNDTPTFQFHQKMFWPNNILDMAIEEKIPTKNPPKGDLKYTTKKSSGLVNQYGGEFNYSVTDPEGKAFRHAIWHTDKEMKSVEE